MPARDFPTASIKKRKTTLKDLQKLQPLFQKLPLTKLIKQNSPYSGEQEDHSLGEDIEFHSYHPYQEGLPTKDIDWRLYQRTQKFYIKRFSALKKQRVHICLDTSLSMLAQIPSTGLTFSLEFMNYLCYYLYLQKQSYSLHLLNDEQQLSVQVAAHQNNFAEIRQLLAKVQFSKSNDHLANLKKIFSQLQPNSNFIYISDFQTELKIVEKIPILLRSQSQSLALTYLIYLDQFILTTLQNQQSLFLAERETNKKFFLNKKKNRQLQTQIATHYAQLAKLCQRQNIHYQYLDNSQSVLTPFLKLFS